MMQVLTKHISTVLLLKCIRKKTVFIDTAQSLCGRHGTGFITRMNCIRHNCEKSQCLEKARTANSAEELLEMAKAENIEISAEEAAKAFAELNKTGELSDEELDNVAGGCGKEKIPEPKYKIGDMVIYSRGFPGHTCGIYRDFQITEVHRSPDGTHTYSIACPECGEKWWDSNVEEETIASLANY